jgi:hypothetical protein
MESVRQTDSVDPHEWSPEEVDTFVRSLGTTECGVCPRDGGVGGGS